MEYLYKRSAQIGKIIIFPNPGFIRFTVKRDGRQIVRDISTYAEYETELKATQAQFDADGWTFVQRHGRPPKEMPRAKAKFNRTSFTKKVEQALHLWKSGGYDNLKDAIQEAHELFRQTPPDLPLYKERLQEMLLEVRKEAERKAKKSPELREYLKGFLQ